jgi:glycosyltransferase involved in cell wall biosynthesis
MRNVCFFNSIKFWGGGEKLQFENALQFHKKGYNVTIACAPDSPLMQKAKTEGISTFGIHLSSLSFLNPIKRQKLISFYKTQAIDTVIFTTSQDAKAGGLAAKKAGVKRIVYLRGLAVPIKGSFVNKKLFSDVLTHIVANSEATKNKILENLSEVIPYEKVKVIYHGIDIPSERKSSSSKKKSGRIVLGNAGRLTKQKGQQHLIPLAKLLKERGLSFELQIAGTGELEEELKTSIEQNNLKDEVKLLGFVEDVPSFMESLDIFVLSSIWEGFGFVIVEAMEKSKPVVAFNLSSNPEIITDGKTGFLIEYPDMEALADKIQQLAEDDQLRQDMGNSGRKSAERRFEISERISEFEQYISSK